MIIKIRGSFYTISFLFTVNSKNTTQYIKNGINQVDFMTSK